MQLSHLHAKMKPLFILQISPEQRLLFCYDFERRQI